MNNKVLSIIIGIGLASILFSFYGVIRGDEFIDALSGIVIGAALIGTAIIQRNKNKKDD